MSKFQLTLSIVFGAFIILAVILFSVYKGSSEARADIVVWGPVPETQFNQLVSTAGLNTKLLMYNYVEKSEATLEKDFTEALATGSGPDLIILPSSLVYKDRNKLLEIPYTSISKGDYQNTFIDEGDLFLSQNGIYALPFEVDPMVLYWNKSSFASAGLAKPIAYWDEIYAASNSLTVKDAAGNITKSVIALGETKNIPHAKDILSLLMLQAGAHITELLNDIGLQATLSSSQNLPVNPAGAAVDFYTQFSDPQKPFYSWNRSLLPAQSSFLVGDSAMYLGFASEYKTLKAKSPTLNIGIASVPQSRTSAGNVTYGKLYGIAISRQSKNVSAALSAALGLISNASQSALTGISGLPSVRRDLLSARQTDPALQVFSTAAIQSKGWIDPNAAATETVFKNLIDNVTSGRARTTEAVLQAEGELQAVIDSK